MAFDDGALRILVRGRGIASDGKLGRGIAESSYTSKPLFRSIGGGNAAGLGLAGADEPQEWSIVTFNEPFEVGAAWDACHDFVAANKDSAEFAEPDLMQRWNAPIQNDGKALGAVRTGDPHPQDRENFPAGAGDLWFRDADHGQFADPAALLPDPGEGRRVRIAHLDTGYDPDHKARPIHLSITEQRNYVDDGSDENDARDQSHGLFDSFSHGTGTLSILAGAPVPGQEGFGCAPYAEIIPSGSPTGSCCFATAPSPRRSTTSISSARILPRAFTS
jgi:hypothetical protein